MSCTRTDFQAEWDSVIKPLTGSLWPYIRQAATEVLEHHLAGSGCGISSSDINHTVFGYAKSLRRRYVTELSENEALRYSQDVLRDLVQEAFSYR